MVSASEQGYYIVKGGGLPPWINVVGLTTGGGVGGIKCQIKAVSQKRDQSFNKGKV